MADDAPGHARLVPGSLVDFVVQRHLAERAGPHSDVRLGTPDTGLVSWAARRGLPTPERSTLFVEQPVHPHSYLKFEGRIPSGYGKGEVQRDQIGRALVTDVGPGHVNFSLAGGKHPRRYSLVRPNGWNAGQWLAREDTPRPRDKPPYVKVHYGRVPVREAEAALARLDPNAVVQPKIDGASSLVAIPPNGRMEMYSYREQRRTGLPISHVEKVYGLTNTPRPVVKLPRELRDAVLRGELYLARRGGKVVSPASLSGALNSSLAKSLEDRRRSGDEFRVGLFDVQRAGGKDVDFNTVPYEERWRMLQKFLPRLPEGFHLIPRVEGPEAALQLWRDIRAGRQPLTREGVVVHPPTGKPVKIKTDEDHDVLLAGTFPGRGRLRGLPGGFTYERLNRPGVVAGRVGSGLSDALRRRIAERPEDWLGRIARVRSLAEFPSGALRNPVFLALHEDQNAPRRVPTARKE